MSEPLKIITEAGPKAARKAVCDSCALKSYLKASGDLDFCDRDCDEPERLVDAIVKALHPDGVLVVKKEKRDGTDDSENAAR